MVMPQKNIGPHARVLDLAIVRGTVSCGMLLDLRVLPTACLVTKSLKVAQRVHHYREPCTP